MYSGFSFPQMGGRERSRLAETIMLPLGPPSLMYSISVTVSHLYRTGLLQKKTWTCSLTVEEALALEEVVDDYHCYMHHLHDVHRPRLPGGGGGRRSTLIVAPRVSRGCGGALC